MAKDQNKNIVDMAWDFMASIKMAIILFALISLTSIVGTVIEQNAEPARNLEVLSSLFGAELAPTLYVFFEKLGFMDMYRSWWFSTMLMLFSANILVCSLDRFPRIWKMVKDPIHPITKEDLRQIPMHKEFTLQGKPGSIKEATIEAARKAGIKVSEANEGGDVQLFGEKGRFSRLGVYVTHLSVIVILAGAVLGILFGFKGQLNIPETAAYTVAFRPVGMLTQEQSNERRIILSAVEDADGDTSVAASNLGVDEDHLRSRMKRLGMLPLDFALRLEDFEVDYYGATDMPKEYSSVLTVIKDGKEILKKRIEVNDPLKYNGITFYQSSYGLLDGMNFIYMFRAMSNTGQSEELAVRFGQEFNVPGTDIVAKVAEFNPALAFDPSGRPFTYSQLMTNPGVRLEITDKTGSYSKWFTKRNSQTWRLTSGEIIEFRDALGAQYTGLSVRRDPGVWIVYLGCAIMSVGLYIAFFMNHKKLWIVLSPAKGSTSVIVAAASNKNRETFERTIDRMISLLREGGK